MTTTDRRGFMKMLGGYALVAGAIPLIPASVGAARSDFRSGLRIESPVAGIDPALGHILHHASRAPSGHNSQPWYVRLIDDRKMIIGADPERRLPAVDPNNRETMLPWAPSWKISPWRQAIWDTRRK